MTPLRLTRDRIWLYACTLAFFGLLPLFVVRSLIRTGDWSNFWSAGATVGTAAFNEPQHHAWQLAHHLTASAFVYVPGAAWLFMPAGHLPIGIGFTLNVAFMLAACVLAGYVAAKVYGLEPQFAILGVFAWMPTLGGILMGQNAPLTLLLTLLAILALVRRRSLLAGLAVGLLFYKTTYAAPFIILLLARREWRALGIVCACAGGWYLASVFATNGDWMWPARYASMLASYAGRDINDNLAKAPSFPALLVIAGVRSSYAAAIGTLLLLIAGAAVARLPLREASTMLPWVALAVSPHALPYDTVLVLPGIFLLMTRASEPWRTRLVVLTYAMGPLWLLVGTAPFDPLAIVAIGGAVVWIISVYRRAMWAPSPQEIG